MPQFDWTPEVVDMLKALWVEGKTASQIARAIYDANCETGPSRCAIIGKVHRLGLARRATGHHVPRAHYDRPVGGLPRPPRPQRIRVAPILTSVKVPAVEPVLTGNEPTLCGLERAMCKYPVGDDTGEHQRFCAQPVCDDGGRPYCDYHRRKTMNPMPLTKRTSHVAGGGGRVMR